MNPIDYIYNLGTSVIWFVLVGILYVIACARIIRKGWDRRRAANLFICALLPVLIGIWGMSVKMPTLIAAMTAPDYAPEHVLENPISALYPLQTGSAMSAILLVLIPLVCRFAPAKDV